MALPCHAGIPDSANSHGQLFMGATARFPQGACLAVNYALAPLPESLFDCWVFLMVGTANYLHALHDRHD